MRKRESAPQANLLMRPNAVNIWNFGDRPSSEVQFGDHVFGLVEGVEPLLEGFDPFTFLPLCS